MIVTPDAGPQKDRTAVVVAERSPLWLSVYCIGSATSPIVTTGAPLVTNYYPGPERSVLSLCCLVGIDGSQASSEKLILCKVIPGVFRLLNHWFPVRGLRSDATNMAVACGIADMFSLPALRS